MSDRHPCDICKLDCFNVDCPLHDLGAIYCYEIECRYCVEDSCILGIRCGASGQLVEDEEEWEENE